MDDENGTQGEAGARERERHGNVRVVYLGHPDVIDPFKRELTRAGARVEDPDEPAKLTLPTSLLRRLFSADAVLSRFAARPGSQVWFFTRAFDVAAVLPRLDADLVIVDERSHLPPTPRRNGSRQKMRDRARDVGGETRYEAAVRANGPESLEPAEGHAPVGDERAPSSPPFPSPGGDDRARAASAASAANAANAANAASIAPSGLVATDDVASASTGEGLVADASRVEMQKDSVPSDQEVLFNTDVARVAEGEELHEQVRFEDLRDAVAKFTPRDFHFPMRRVMVVLPEGRETPQRTFQLGLANVRRVLIAPPSSVELFLFATHQVADFRRAQTKTALCIAGGGLEGYIYAVGCVQALEACFAEASCSDFDIFCGVSSGSILGLSLAAGLSVDELVGQLYKRRGKLEPLSLSVVFDFAGGELVRRLVDLVRVVPSLDPSEFVARLQRTIPVGFFKGERLKAFVESQLARAGVTDNIAALRKELYISATDQDTGEHVVFGEEPWRDVKASQAVRASTALPPFYLPERVKGHWFTDGQLTSSSDFNTAIRKGARLVVLVDPMVAYTSVEPGAVMKNGGYFTAVQAIKSLVQSRAQSFLKHSMDVHPDVDFVVFRPTDEVMEAMAGNPMRYRIRTELAELGYKGTLSQILAQYEALSHRFGKHGFVLRERAEIKALVDGR